MATPPIVCNTIDFEGVIFQRCNLQVLKGSTVLREISLCDTDITINNYSSFSGCVYGGSSLLLNSDGLNELSFIMIKATYPASLPVSNRFINIIYNGDYLPMSNLTIFTGNPKDSSPYLYNRGWDLNPNGSDIVSPFFNEGGMILYNPHNVRVNVEVILADGFSVSTPSSSNILTDEDGDFLIT